MSNFENILKLESLSVEEKFPQAGSGYNLLVDLFTVGDFNLFISDNAQGKTRLFNSLKFICLLFHTGTYQSAANQKTQFNFILKNGEVIKHKILYVLEVLRDEKGQLKFKEQVEKDGRILFSSDKNMLIDENTKEQFPKFFAAPNTPAVLSISGDGFETIELIKDFIKRICFVDSSRQKALNAQAGATLVDSMGFNIAEVLYTWQIENKDAYDEVIYDFKKYFPFVEHIKVDEVPANPIAGMPVGQKAHMLSLKEKNVSMAIPHLAWSDGMLRALTLLAMPKGFTNFNGKQLPPSLICIDEIEEALDFKSLKFIIDYYQDCSKDIQVIFTSHSPLVCGFVHPRDWRVFKRNGAFVNVFSPSEKEPDLEKQLDLYKQKYWDFYREHINNSDLYKFKPRQ
jgi:AAA15 family ATPase/GTPase